MCQQVDKLVWNLWMHVFDLEAQNILVVVNSQAHVCCLSITMILCSELGKADDGEVFDPSKLDPNRCESCYGAETEDLK